MFRGGCYEPWCYAVPVVDFVVQRLGLIVVIAVPVPEVLVRLVQPSWRLCRPARVVRQVKAIAVPFGVALAVASVPMPVLVPLFGGVGLAL